MAAIDKEQVEMNHVDDSKARAKAREIGWGEGYGNATRSRALALGRLADS